jgi:hypothetical protein
MTLAASSSLPLRWQRPRELNKKFYATIGTWRNRSIEGEHPYVYLDAGGRRLPG